MEFELHPVETRILGALIEKEITTPEYYPLSLNALINACNQKSNRDPVVFFDEETVLQALDSLREKGLTTVITGAGSRVPKYSHRFAERLNLGRREIAILCELMLRGPQTAGEIRNRAERLHRFNDLDEVESLVERMPGFIVRLAKRPGENGCRYAHLLAGEPAAVAASTQEASSSAEAAPRNDRVAALEADMAQLRREFDELRQSFLEFRRQLE